MLTGIGGGMVRDVLTAEVPSVLRGDIYAVAALAGAGVVVIGRMAHLPSAAMTFAGAVLCFALRYMAIRHRGICRLPVVPRSGVPGKARWMTSARTERRVRCTIQAGPRNRHTTRFVQKSEGHRRGWRRCP